MLAMLDIRLDRIFLIHSVRPSKLNGHSLLSLRRNTYYALGSYNMFQI